MTATTQPIYRLELSQADADLLDAILQDYAEGQAITVANGARHCPEHVERARDRLAHVRRIVHRFNHTLAEDLGREAMSTREVEALERGKAVA